MKLERISPMIYTRALKETILFYTEKLGFTCDVFGEEWGWASLHRDQVCIMLSLPNKHMPFEKPIFTGSFYINVSNVDEIWNEIRSKADILYPINNFEYGMREFAVTDNNGYILQFGQNIS